MHINQSKPVSTFLLCLVVFGLQGSPIAESRLNGQEPITPDSEFVLSMVRPAVAFLKSHEEFKPQKYGEAALVGLAIYNAGLRLGRSPTELRADPKLNAILNLVVKKINGLTRDSERRIYAPCVSAILLAEVNSEKYAEQIKIVLGFLEERQQDLGGWGYTREVRGDISQTQYGALFLWLAKEKKFQVKEQSIANAIRFLVGSQHGSGGYTYKAEPRNLIGDVTNSLTAAGMGAVYLLGDAYGLHGGESKAARKRNAIEQLLPPTVSLVVENEEKKKNTQGPIRQMPGFGQAKQRGDNWLRGNWTVNPAHWTYYYLYGYERYASFKEKAENSGDNPSPPWYVQGARFLKQQQGGDGSWLSKNAHESSTAISTSFAVLFLVRSTKLLIPVNTPVSVSGGGPIPQDGKLAMKNGRLVNATFNKDYEDVMALLHNKASDTDWENFEKEFDGLILSSNAGSRTQQFATLRPLVKHENPVARKVAVKSLGKSRSFKNVPFLIYALSDPEPEIAKLADDGLRFISRKFSSQKLSATPSKQEMRSVIKTWSDWYLTVVPEGELLEDE